MTFALEFRPRTFADVVGQGHVKAVLKAMVSQHRVPPALLFGGSRGTGKTTTARIFAAALNCESPVDGDSCAACVPCKAVAAGNSMAVLEIDAASNGLVDDIRKIKEMVAYEVGGQAEWRVVLLDEAHSMSKPAFNALLKVLEEPPDRTVFVLLTTEVGRIPETVVSRSMTFDFRRHTVADIEDRLREIAKVKELKVSDDLLSEVSRRSEGGMRDAVMTLDQLTTVGIEEVEGYHRLFGIRDVAVPLFEAALGGDHVGGSAILDDYFRGIGDASGMVADLVSLVRDLLVLSSGGEVPVVTKEALADRERLVKLTPMDRLVAVVQVLWDLRHRTRATDGDQRAAMEMAFVLISDALQDRIPSEPIPHAESSNGKGERSLSIGELKNMAARFSK